MKIHLIVAGLIVLALLVFSEGITKWYKVQADSKIAQIEDPIICSEHGGTIERVCMTGHTMCVVKYQDAGNSCSDSSECEGACLSVLIDAQIGDNVEGACAISSDPCGRFLPLRNGKVFAKMWVD